MTILHPVPVRSDRFTWHAPTRTFVAEISDLGGRFGRVYDDACDEGLTLVSARDGRELVLVVNHEERREGDTLWWDLVPATFKPCGFNVRVYND